MSSRGKAAESSTASASTSDHSSTNSAPAPTKSANVSSSVVAKLAFFTGAMVIVPIGTYFVSLNKFFEGNATYAGICAAVMANVVLIAYVIAAVLEDSQTGRNPVSSKKKQQ
ncbi:vacuolar ATPase assembly integral membrane protein vma21 [Lunasporangiospora selenospora]|uniref:Vacuolar ATPase assembly integral membrane protein vma21 n=1 Tax=Lunasporangiospora selenospora TaxID=979761 RepID=A0A9P6FUK7_9FUNG|nr:vacuolar ATPase assembly integral membrane protein vma21 [Lunasporangiospora selenospora]